jgi:Zn finger protein HypA/HybF involved in hydrogenase expression
MSTKKRNSPSRIKWVRGDQLNRWVTCIECDHEYYIESFELNPCCPVCESKQYEETTPEKDYLDYDDLDGLL